MQETWVRCSAAGADQVNNLGGWLTTIVTRICLNALRARASRPETLAGPHGPDPVLSPAAGPTPEQEALLADSVGLALLVVLDTLTPAERVAFVLHDVFDVPFGEIAPMLDRTPEAARQLASRARQRVKAAGLARARRRGRRAAGGDRRVLHRRPGRGRGHPGRAARPRRGAAHRRVRRRAASAARGRRRLRLRPGQRQHGRSGAPGADQRGGRRADHAARPGRRATRLHRRGRTGHRDRRRSPTPAACAGCWAGTSSSRKTGPPEPVGRGPA